ncbi:MAG: hypothetical protein ISS48_00750 [Candidatus Aenigmarchaeota archaeon]|nr:hypothetical protein [Candidatus Aenigmarchaeota archaeon]
MGMNYYKACKCCGHHKVHLGKTSAGEKGTILLSNFENKEAVLDVAKTKENEEIVDG